MPAKYKESERTNFRKRGGPNIKAKHYKHYYLKCATKETLFEEINRYGVKPKVKQKCVNELIRRGVKIQWVNLTQDS
jgi:hypothetical protein